MTKIRISLDGILPTKSIKARSVACRNRFIKIKIKTSKRPRKKSIVVGVAVVIASLLSIYGVLYLLTPYSGFARSIIWGDSDIKDYERFPSRTIENASPVFYFLTENGTNSGNSGTLSQILFDNIVPNTGISVCDVEDGGKMNFDKFLASTGTTAFIVIKDDKILYEKYFNGYQLVLLFL
jgi:hypothetical protein